MTEPDDVEFRKRRLKSRLQLIGFFMVAFVPIFLATFMYFSKTWIPEGRVNNGRLIKPPIAFDNLVLKPTAFQRREDDGDSSEKQTLGKWRLITAGEGVCSKTCENSLYKMRQVRKSLGRDFSRVECLYVDAGKALDPGLVKLLEKEYPLFTVNKGDKKILLNNVFENLDDSYGLHSIFIADPNGNIFMVYQPEQDGKEILDDLKKLLRLSKIG